MRFLVTMVLIAAAFPAAADNAFSQCSPCRDSVARDTVSGLSGSTQTIGFEQFMDDLDGVMAFSLRVTDIVRHGAGADVGVVIITQHTAGVLFEGGPAWALGSGSMALLPRFGVGALLGQGGIVPELYVGASFMMRLGPAIGFRLDVSQRHVNIEREWFPLTSFGGGITFLTPPRSHRNP